MRRRENKSKARAFVRGRVADVARQVAEVSLWAFETTKQATGHHNTLSLGLFALGVSVQFRCTPPEEARAATAQWAAYVDRLTKQGGGDGRRDL
jgi:hypothetical protein